MGIEYTVITFIEVYICKKYVICRDEFRCGGVAVLAPKFCAIIDLTLRDSV